MARIPSRLGESEKTLALAGRRGLGGWKDVSTLTTVYMQADHETMARVAAAPETTTPLVANV